ncbi:uncharacterized protein LOC123542674 [Mercenaria mercenaria]|uniref:uncharacterized protein LOC123542674 n=1 Tax=Mercenaria mercenaria TaxID=6596 RepID=UPI001E1DE271|nr:uncharacterized protein LOC123542674 [Mercenaria mercenaria]XP_045184559.1 uncharacterized protein LOC123542674 [Mercenaria mercenaria]
MMIFILLLSFVSGIESTIRCFECVDAPHPADCGVITLCPDSDQCMTRQFVSSGGLILYTSGCESKYKCGLLGKRDREDSQLLVRGNTDIPVCEHCCNDDFCNVNGCGVSKLPQPYRGPFCLQCHDEDDPRNCRHVAQCALEETCSVNQILDHNFDGIVRFHSGCIRDIQCTALALTSKTHNLCFKCCSQDFCNDECSSTTAAVTHRY